MSAGRPDRQRGKREASHRGSVAQKLVCWAAVACACDGGLAAPSGDPPDPDDLDGDGIANAEDVCPTGQYALAAAGADVTVTSLAVYGSPTACPTAALAACNLP